MVRSWLWVVALAASLVGGLGLGAPPAASAAVREARVPVQEGRVQLADLSALLCREAGLPECRLGGGSIDVSGLRGSRLVAALNESLGEGCNVSLAGDALVLRVDPDKLPADCDAAKKATRVFAAVACPEATAAQRAFYGLALPENVDVNRPLVVLVHGLDSDRVMWAPMTELLTGEGYPVAYFTYPSDQPLVDSAAFLAAELAAARAAVPGLKLNLVAHSMGGLVAREYVEGDAYAGGVDHLVLIGTPNSGSDWAKWRLALEVQEHYHLWRHEPGWGPSWLVTDGLGEAGRDLKPGSDFLKTLNARPRRAGVKYTVVAGSLHPANRVTANCAEKTARLIPGRVSHWWGLRHCKNGLNGAAEKMRHNTGATDGPVAVESARLEGVEDFVVLPADHASLYIPLNGSAPAAWETVKDRLAK